MTMVTCIICYHNAEAHLAKALRSVQRQSRPDFKCIMVDDGSTDQGPALAAAAAAADPRFALASLGPAQGPQGKAAASKAAEAMLDTEYVCFVDADDWLSGDAFYEAAKALELQPEAPACLTDMLLSNEDATAVRPCPGNGQPFSYDGIYDVRLPFHLMMMRTDLFIDAGGLDEEFRVGQMYELRLRLAKAYGPFARVYKPLYFWRQWPGQTTARARAGGASAPEVREAVARARRRHGRLKA